MTLLICTPLRLEAQALASAPKAAGVQVVRVGAGVRRARAAARRLPGFEVLVVAGFGGGLVEGLAPGELVVASEVRFGGVVHACPQAGSLAAALPAPVRAGALVTSDHLVTGAERSGLAATGAVAVDMEAGPLVAAAVARGRPFAVVRAVVDTPERPLLRAATLRSGAAALRRLRALPPVLVQWAFDPSTESSPRR